MLTPLPFLTTSPTYIHPELLITEDDIRLALLSSDDPRTQVAAFIVSPIEGHILSSGCNMFANWKLVKPDRTLTPAKYDWIQHAEARAICNAAKRGVKLEDARIYVTAPPCLSCANMIIASGISKVCVPAVQSVVVSDKWNESIENAYQAFQEARVQYELIAVVA